MDVKKIGTELWDFFKKNFAFLTIGIVLLIGWGQGCFNRFGPQKPIILHDTVTVIHDYTSAPYTPPVINVLPAKPTVVNQPQYQPDTSSIQALRKQFDELVKQHTVQRTYNDSLKIDSIGWVNVKDTVSENKLASRGYNYKINERKITTTITQPYKPRNQVFVGIDLNTEINDLINGAELGFMFKNKKDNVFRLAVGSTFQGQKTASIGYYHIISFRSKSP